MKLYAVVIGERVKNLRYVCFKEGSMTNELAVFDSRDEAREERHKVLVNCGHKSVHVIPFHSRDLQ